MLVSMTLAKSGINVNLKVNEIMIESKCPKELIVLYVILQCENMLDMHLHLLNTSIPMPILENGLSLQTIPI